MSSTENNTGTPPDDANTPPRRRKLPWILLLIFVMGLTLGAAGFVATTENGLRWAFSTLVRNIPGELRVEQLDGRLIGPLSIRGLHYTTAEKNTVISIEKLDVDIHPLALLYERVHISRLAISGVNVTHTGSQEPLTALPNIQLPVGITLDQASISTVNVTLPDLKQSYLIDHITLTGKTLFGRLHIDTLNITAHALQAQVRGTLMPKNSYPVNLVVHWSALPTGYPPVTGQTTLTGNLVNELKIAQSVSTPLKATVHGTVKNMLGTMQWQADLALKKTNLHDIHQDWPAIDIGGKLRITTQEHGPDSQSRIIAEGNIQVTYEKTTLNTLARANFSDNKWYIEQATLSLPDQPARVILKGTLGNGLIPALDQPWQLAGRWHDFVWPPGATTDAALVSKEGSFDFTGNPDAYQFTINGSITGAAIPSGRWRAAGNGNPEGLALNELRGDILAGHITGQGELRWQLPPCGKTPPHPMADRTRTPCAQDNSPGTPSPASPQLHWLVNLAGNNLDPGQHWSAWPGQLDFQARISNISLRATTNHTEPRATITDVRHNEEHASAIFLEINDLRGQLRDIPLTGNASLIIDQDTYAVSHFTLASGPSLINIRGTLNETWNMRWDAVIQNADNNPAEIFPGTHLKYSGTLKGHGNLDGTREQPRISAELQGKKLTIDNYRANELHLAFDVDTQNLLMSQLDLTASDITVCDQTIDSIVVQGRGLAQNHVIDATLKTAGKSLVLRLEGALGERVASMDNTQTTPSTLQAASWAGQLTQANMTSQTLGYWPLTTPGVLTLATDHAQLGPWCWTQQEAQICFNATRAADTHWQGNAHTTNLPITWLQYFLPKQAIVAGTLDATVNAHLNPAGLLTGTARILPSPGAIIHPLANDQNLTLVYTKGLIEATLDADTLNTSATLTLTNKGVMDGTLLLPRSALPAFLTNPASQSTHIKGQLNAEIHELDLLPDFFPDIENTQGKINIALNVEGTPEQPRFGGYAKLEQGTALVPRLGLRLEDIRAQITGKNDNQLTLAAQARSGKGVLKINGTLSPDNKQRWGADLTVQGEHFEAVHTPEMQATVSPNLTIKVVGNTVDVNGNLVIPYANIELRDLNTTLRPSSDAVVIHADKETSDPQTTDNQHWLINSIVGVKLGDNVRFNGIGLTGRFTGDIALIDAPQQLTAAYGEIRIEDGGKYRAVNQKLEVKKGGRLVFAGGPVNNPGIDARATRQINTNVRVGFNVRGTLQSPQLSVYSEPAMPETDALAYLLFGRPMSQTSAAEGSQMAVAAAGLGAAGGEFLMKKIGNTFGIEDIRVETSTALSSAGTPTTTQQATVVLGKYLSPKLYISYGVGTVDRINTLRLRYQLSRHWTVEAESGFYQGADILYTIDRK